MARGSIVKKKSALTGKVSYQARVELPPDPVTGKRKQGSETFRTRELAQKRLTARLNEIEQGTAVAPDKITVAMLLTDWLEKVARHKVRPTTMQGYRFTIEHYLVPELGTVPVQKLTKAHLQKLNSALFDQGKKDRTIQLCHMRLSQALDWAIEMGYVVRNVCQGFKDRPTPKKRKPTIWTPQQVELFLDEAGDWRPLFETMIFTGLRRGEALGLR